LFFSLRRRAWWTGLALWVVSVLAARTLGNLIVFKFVPCFAGGLIAYQGLQARPGRLLSSRLWLAALLAVSIFHAAGWRTHEQDFFGYVSCLMLGILIPRFRELPVSWLTRAGHTVAKYSYGIYLAHIPAIWFAFVKLAPAPGWLRWSVLVLMMLALPVILYHLLEAPLIRVGRTLADGICRRRMLSRYPLAHAAD
jgi:peptidoglycan/LPS O-acetylase OafA/YrhL